MHLGSEVGPYFTRYLATIKDKIAILVTFSAHKEHYTKYSADFIKAVESLRVVATKDTLGNRSVPDLGGPANGVVGPSPDAILSNFDNSGLPGEAPQNKSGKFMTLLLLILLFGAAGGYLYLRSKRKSAPKSPPRPPAKPKSKPK
jgi:hypothetical protein